MSDEEEEFEYEIPAWSPPFLGWAYEITTYDDGTAAVGVGYLPEFISIEFDGEGTWKLSAEIEEFFDLELTDEDIDSLFEQANEYFEPLGALFLKA